MRFGNWQITAEGIRWNGTGLHRFEIDRESLTQLHENGSDETPMYEWILLATAEDWLTQDDLYDLNFAFVYAVAQYGMPFDYKIFDNTLEEQYDQFDEEDDEDEDWP